jgi:NitT/TauT family transport system substrate-binding protein
VKRFIRAGIAALALGGLAALQTGASAQSFPKPEKTAIVFGIIPTPDYVPVLIGIQRGYFKEEGLDVTTRSVLPAATMPALLSGSLDVSGLNWISTLVAYNRNVPVKIWAESDRGVNHYAEIVVKADSPIKSLKDLIGKKMASPSPPPGNCDIPVRAAMRAAKLDESAVNFIDLAIPQMPGAIASGAIDAACLPEPFLSSVMKTGAIRSIFDVFGGPRVGTPIANYATSSEFASKNPNTLAALERAVAKSMRYCVDHPDAVRAALVAFAKLTPEQAKATVLPTYVTRVDPAAADRLAKTMVEVGVLPAPVRVPPIGGP